MRRRNNRRPKEKVQRCNHKKRTLSGLAWKMKRLRAEMSAGLWGKIRENNKWDTEENP